MTAIDDCRLRVLLVIESCGGGSARHVADLAAGLLAEGHDVEVAYSPLRADGWFLAELQALTGPGLVMHSIDMFRNPGLHDAKAARQLRALLKDCKPFDVVHGHSAKAGALVRLAGYGDPALKVYTPHAFITLDPELGAKKRLVYTVAERLLAPLADGIVCVSNEEKDHAESLGISSQLLVTIENGLAPLPDADREAARSTLGLKESDVCFGFVGRISGQKPVARLVLALQLLYTQCPNAVVVIVGEGPDYEDVQQLAQTLNIEDRVRFTGAADGQFLMAGFDVFVLPSSYEAFPYVYLEALARGLPIISTDVGGSAAVIDHGVNGYIVPQNKLELLTKYMAVLTEDCEMRGRMSQHSLEKSKQFTVKNMVANTIAVYKSLKAQQG